MAITAQMVKELREMTGPGMMDCKNALTETDGDMKAAAELLREKGIASAAKKAGRVAAEGLVKIAFAEDGSKGAIVEVNSETDFVAKNVDFQNFVQSVAKTIAETNPKDVETLYNEKLSGNDRTVLENLQDRILSIGENIKIRRFVRNEGIVSIYIHGGGSVGVMVNFDTDSAAAATDAFKVMGKDVAMQIAAMSPQHLNKNSVPADVLEYEKGIIAAQLKEDPKMASKPQNVLDGIIAGKIAKELKEMCLAEQQFVKNNDLTVEQYVESVAKELDTKITVTGFVRFAKGEGLEKREDNFADEVACMIK